MTESTAPAVVCVTVTPEGLVGGGWGKAPRVAVAEVVGGDVTSWTEHAVGWDALHDEGGEGSHHARIVRFLREHAVQAVATGHMGPPMQNTLGKLGVRVLLGATGDARAAAVAAAGLAEDGPAPS